MTPETLATPPANSIGDTLLAWQAPVIPPHVRSPRWYLVGGIAVLLGAAYGILSGSWSFAIVIVLCGGMYFLLRDHVPSNKRITITTDGVMFEESFIRWEDLDGFWMLITAKYNQLHLLRKDPKARDIVILTGDIDPLTVKTTLAEHIPERTEKREHLFDLIIRICKL